jgi:uncharacterized membrane protein
MDKIKKWVKDGLWGGFILVGPLGLIWALSDYAWDMIASVVAPVSNLISFLPFSDVIAVAIVLTIMTMIGQFTRTHLGGWVHSIVDPILLRIPFYKTIRSLLGQLFSGSIQFDRVVLVKPFGQEGAILLGFVADEHVFADEGELMSGQPEDLITVYVPSSPNPTNGQVYTVKRRATLELDISVGEASQTIMSMGTTKAVILAALPDHAWNQF